MGLVFACRAGNAHGRAAVLTGAPEDRGGLRRIPAGGRWLGSFCVRRTADWNRSLVFTLSPLQHRQTAHGLPQEMQRNPDTSTCTRCGMAPTSKRRCASLTCNPREEVSAAAAKDSPQTGGLCAGGGGGGGSGRQPSARLQAQAKKILETDTSLSPSRQGKYSKDDYIYESASPSKRRRHPTLSPGTQSGEGGEPVESPTARMHPKKRAKGSAVGVAATGGAAGEEGEKENMQTIIRIVGYISIYTIA